MKTINKRKATYYLIEESNTNNFSEHHGITMGVPTHEPNNDGHVPQHNGDDEDIIDLSTFGL